MLVEMVERMRRDFFIWVEVSFHSLLTKPSVALCAMAGSLLWPSRPMGGTRSDESGFCG